MSVEHDRVIAKARGERSFICLRCRYELDGVPMNDAHGVVCPECGYEMRFHVQVRLESNDQVYQQSVKKTLNRMDRVLTRLAFGLVAVAVVVVLVMIFF